MYSYTPMTTCYHCGDSKLSIAVPMELSVEIESNRIGPIDR